MNLLFSGSGHGNVAAFVHFYIQTYIEKQHKILN